MYWKWLLCICLMQEIINWRIFHKLSLCLMHFIYFIDKNYFDTINWKNWLVHNFYNYLAFDFVTSVTINKWKYRANARGIVTCYSNVLFDALSYFCDFLSLIFILLYFYFFFYFDKLLDDERVITQIWNEYWRKFHRLRKRILKTPNRCINGLPNHHYYN